MLTRDPDSAVPMQAGHHEGVFMTMPSVSAAEQRLHQGEMVLLEELRKLRRSLRQQHPPGEEDLTFGQRIADSVADGMGSWRFIIIQTTLLTIWVVLNITAWVRAWDPYPFILLNLALSFQAAYAAPIIMMAQNRQQDIDRKAAENDYKINIKAELEIELLHQKLDQLREQEVVQLSLAVKELSELLNRSGIRDTKDGKAPAPGRKPARRTPRKSASGS
jgi:uncharacterized membrane protein